MNKQMGVCDWKTDNHFQIYQLQKENFLNVVKKMGGKIPRSSETNSKEKNLLVRNVLFLKVSQICSQVLQLLKANHNYRNIWHIFFSPFRKFYNWKRCWRSYNLPPAQVRTLENIPSPDRSWNKYFQWQRLSLPKNSIPLSCLHVSPSQICFVIFSPC